ncbi:MAG: hypothetical protein RLZZ293_28 [Pseudomonadota bacterium]|jgi:CRISPR system Cascade subunit CasB
MSRSTDFVNYILRQLDNSGTKASLKRADNPATEYQSWEILARFNIDLSLESQRLPHNLIMADMARVHPTVNGKIKLAQALALCYDDHNQSEQAKAKLRRVLSCDTTSELCRILRPLFSLIASKGIILDYVSLLDQLLYFNHDEIRHKIKARWAQDFYGLKAEEVSYE